MFCCQATAATELVVARRRVSAVDGSVTYGARGLDLERFMQQEAPLKFSCWIVNGKGELRLPLFPEEAEHALLVLDETPYNGPLQGQGVEVEYRTTSRI